MPASEWRGGEADGLGAAFVPWLSACARHHGTLARLSRADGLAPPTGRVAKGLDPDQVRRLLAACDVGTVVANRDLEILTLQLRLGLRRDEVAGLGLDDIDWRAGNISVRGKGNRHERLPLPPDVGRRLADYLRHARPANAQGRTVFVRHFAPHHALGASRVSGIVADAARRAGLGRVHAHRLRHTAATELLRAGASLPEIGQILRHRRTETTAIYAKVDRNTLRLIARPWPEGDL